MAQRFIRCQLCGIPHPAEMRECPVHRRPIVPAPQMAPAPGPAPAVRAPTPAVPPPRAAPPRPPARLPTPPPAVARALALPDDEPAAPLTAPEPLADTAGEGEVIAPRPPPAAPLVGRLLVGRYRVSGVIASGGMGVVYDAVHVALGRRVAIKTLHKRYANDAVALARFQNEAVLAGQFGHPNIVEVYDMGTLEDGAPFLVMERLEGETVTQRLVRERPLRVAVAVDVAQQVLSALVTTHARGILHRDLKPDNLFLAKREGLAPVVKVLDFGISQNLLDTSTSVRLTRQGFVMGTPAYMAPEQARGERTLDLRVDLYAVGMILYEMLAGKLPFQSRAPAGMLKEIQKLDAPRVRALRPEVTLALDAVVAKAMARDRDARFPDAGTMLRALQQAQHPGADDGDVPIEDPTEITGPPPELPPPGMDSGSQRVEVFTRRKK